MMHCSEKARALCSHRRCCGAPEPVEIPTDGWCAGFNAGVAKALETSVDLEPLIDSIKSLTVILQLIIRNPVEVLPKLMVIMAAVRTSLVKSMEGSDGRT